MSEQLELPLLVEPTNPDPGSRALGEWIDKYEVRRTLTLDQALETLDVVNVEPDDGFMVMAERDPQLTRSQALPELGYSSPSPWTAWTREEHVTKLRDRQGLREYYKMKRADGTVRGSLNLLKTPPRSARWFIEPASESTIDVNIANFISDNLFEGLNVSWSRLLDDILLMCEYGHMVFEKVFDIDERGRVKLRKLAPRHPLDVREWRYDDNGGPDGVVMEPTEMSGTTQGIFIPIAKLAIFSLDAEGGDLRGISVLRSAYKHFFYKETLYKIDAIQKERHGIGVPCIKLPPNFSTDDKKLANELGRNLRTNERAHVVLPPGWELLFLKLEGNPVDCIKSIQHHNQELAKNILAPFMDQEKSKSDEHSLYLKSTRYIADTVCDIFNHHIIRQLVDFNFIRGKYPKLRVRRIGEWDDLRTLSFALRNLIGAEVIRADDELEKAMRREFDLPPADKDTARIRMAPQSPFGGGAPDQPGQPQPPQVGLPRQSPNAPVGLGSSRTGADRSGGT